MVAVTKNFSITRTHSEQGRAEKDQIREQTSSAFSNQIILSLTELWYRESFQSSLYMAHTLDELGVEKYLPVETTRLDGKIGPRKIIFQKSEPSFSRFQVRSHPHAPLFNFPITIACFPNSRILE